VPDQALDLVKRVAPLDADGMNLSRPANQVLWTLLQNVVITSGRIESRPGLVPVGPRSQDVTTISPGIPAVIMQAQQYLDEDTSIGKQERLAPTSTVSAGTWAITGAATVHEALDDNPPDEGTTKVDSSTDADAFRLGFANPSNTLDVVDGVIIYTRARAKVPGERAVLTVTDIFGTYGTIDLSSGQFDSDAVLQPGWQDYFLFAPIRPNGDPWKKTDVNSITLTWTLTTSTTWAIDILIPQTYGSDNDFSEATLSNWVDSTEIPIAFFDIDKSTFTNATALGDKMSVTFDGLDGTWASIDSIEVRCKTAKRTVGPNPSIQFYHKGTDSVDRDLGSEVVVNAISNNTTTNAAYVGQQLLGGTVKSSGEVSLNPETGVAWTPAEVNAGLECGIEVAALPSGQSVEVSSMEIIVRGASNTSGAEVDAVAVIAMGRSLSSGDPSLAMGRIMGTHTGFMRLDEQTNTEDGFVDVSTGIAGPTASPLDWDWTEFGNKLYVANAADKLYRYPDATDTFDQITTDMLGHTIWTFGNRLMMGDVIDAGTRHPRRVAWGALAADDTWSGDAAAGDLDLTHGGQGRIVKGLPLSSHVTALYLDKGIYNLSWTGDDSAPFLPRIVDTDTGIVAPNTCKAVIDSGGSATHLFLGRGPGGIDIYSYDGSQAIPIGGEINSDLVSRANPQTIRHSFAEIEPRNNLYLLFVPEGDQLYPEQCWVYHIESGHWTRWTFPVAITCAGQWKLVAPGDVVPSKTVEIQDGETELILATSFGAPYWFNPDRFTDVTVPGGNDNEITKEYFVTSATDGEGYWDRETPIDVDVRTGDVEFSDDGNTRLTGLKRVFITYVDRGGTDITIDESLDGGATFTNTINATLSGTNSGKIRNADFQIPTPTSGRRHMVRIRTTDSSERQKLEIIEYSAYYQDYGEVP